MERNTILWFMINKFFFDICTHGSDQVVLQRYFSTAAVSAARRSYLINVCVELLMAGLLGTAGLALLAFYLRHNELLPPGNTAVGTADRLFPHFLGHQLPTGLARDWSSRLSSATPCRLWNLASTRSRPS